MSCDVRLTKTNLLCNVKNDGISIQSIKMHLYIKSKLNKQCDFNVTKSENCL